MRHRIKTIAIVAGLALGFAATNADAGSVKLSGDADSSGIHFRKSNGGEFRMNFVNGDTGFTLGNDPAGVHDIGTYLAGGWQTFCVERDEYVSIGGTYDYTVDSFVKHSSGNRALAAGTAYLYTEFWNGTLGQGTSSAYNYDYTAVSTSDREDTARALQLAIWQLQGFTTFDVSEYAGNALAQSYVQLANNAVAGSWGNSIGEVRVVNLFTSSGAQKQSQLVVVPLPPAAFAGLGLLGVLGLVRLRRRRRTA